MSADQIRRAFAELTGVIHQGAATLPDPGSPQGQTTYKDADLLDVYASALGRPDYDSVVKPSASPRMRRLTSIVTNTVGVSGCESRTVIAVCKMA